MWQKCSRGWKCGWSAQASTLLRLQIVGAESISHLIETEALATAGQDRSSIPLPDASCTAMSYRSLLRVLLHVLLEMKQHPRFVMEAAEAVVVTNPRSSASKLGPPIAVLSVRSNVVPKCARTILFLVRTQSSNTTMQKPFDGRRAFVWKRNALPPLRLLFRYVELPGRCAMDPKQAAEETPGKAILRWRSSEGTHRGHFEELARPRVPARSVAECWVW